MFGATRRVPAGPALLSLSSGAPLIVCPVVHDARTGGRSGSATPLEIERTGDLRDDVTALSRLMAERFERAIAARPTDWHMFQPAWRGSTERCRADRASVKSSSSARTTGTSPGGVQVHVRQLARRAARREGTRSWS